jgi:hypothetical protein
MPVISGCRDVQLAHTKAFGPRRFANLVERFVNKQVFVTSDEVAGSKRILEMW